MCSKISSLDGAQGPELDFTLGPLPLVGTLKGPPPPNPRLWPQFPHVRQRGSWTGPMLSEVPRLTGPLALPWGHLANLGRLLPQSSLEADL